MVLVFGTGLEAGVWGLLRGSSDVSSVLTSESGEVNILEFLNGCECVQVCGPDSVN